LKGERKTNTKVSQVSFPERDGSGYVSKLYDPRGYGREMEDKEHDVPLFIRILFFDFFKHSPWTHLLGNKKICSKLKLYLI
jgi:hypothetical protein